MTTPTRNRTDPPLSGSIFLTSLSRQAARMSKQTGAVVMTTSLWTLREASGRHLHCHQPSGTLAASVGVGGRIRRIDVNDVSGLDEAQLSEEIAELATLAREGACRSTRSDR